MNRGVCVHVCLHVQVHVYACACMCAYTCKCVHMWGCAIEVSFVAVHFTDLFSAL